MPREIHDHYFHKAKSEGYRSRAAYKLIEIDDRRKVLRPGDAVLDAGCAPGSWLQVAAKRIGPKGIVVGIDLAAIDAIPGASNIHIIQGDFTTTSAADLLAPIRKTGSGVVSSSGGRTTPDPFFSVILSDMAPSTTGDRTIDHHASARLAFAVLDRCGELLAPGGNLVIKVLEGETYPDLLRRAGAMFDKVKGFKPAASRSESTEIYLIAHGYKGPSARGAEDSASAPDPSAHDQLPRRKPSTGWSTPAR
jgi:23S rRNA (uridine2552-2'-O)-methyltransferase